MATTCEVDIAIGCVLAHISKNVGSIGPYNIMAVQVIFTMLQSNLFCDIKYVYSDMRGDLVHMHAHLDNHMHTCIQSYMHTEMYIKIHICLATYIPNCMHSNMHPWTYT